MPQSPPCLRAAFALVALLASASASAPTSYGDVLSAQRSSHAAFSDLPGFTRSVYRPDFALVTPESRVWGPAAGWRDVQLAYLVSKASGAHFSMFLAQMQVGGHAGQARAWRPR